MPPSLIQSIENDYGNALLSLFTQAFGSNVTAGSILVACWRGPFGAGKSYGYGYIAGNVLTIANGPSYAISSANTAVGANTTYNGTFPATSLAGISVEITGFVTHTSNNGFFTVVSNTTTTLVVANASGVAETQVASVLTNANNGYFAPGIQVYGSGVAYNTYIATQLTGTPGGVGTYTVSVPQNVASSGSPIPFTAASQYVTDTQGNYWQEFPDGWVNGNDGDSLWFAAGAKAGATTVHINCFYSNFIRLGIAEFSGVAQNRGAAYNASNHTVATGTAVNSGNISPTIESPYELLLVGFLSNPTTDGNVAVPPVSWTQILHDGFTNFFMFYKVVPQGTYNLSATYTTSCTWGAAVVAFNAIVPRFPVHCILD